MSKRWSYFKRLNFYFNTEQSKNFDMSRTTLSQQSKGKQGLELFSELMVMKFKPKSLEGNKKAKQTSSIRTHLLKDTTHLNSSQEQDRYISSKLNHILYKQLASTDTVVLGNYNQLDMFDLDGLTNGFVDTFHYWSFCPGIPIMNLKVNMKKQMMMIYSVKTIMVYTYETIKRQVKVEPVFMASIQLKNQLLFMQFPSTDLIALFYQNYFEIYSVNDSFVIQKKLQKKYNVDMKKFKLFSVPQGIDNNINIFFEEPHDKLAVFGLWCVEINVFSGTIRQNQPYKIYDILSSLKKHMLLKNYTKDMIVMNLGQEILVASKGYIVDSVNINIQQNDTYLKLIPNRQILLHIQQNFMEVYQFKINTSVLPNRIELSSIDSIQITGVSNDCKLLDVLPVFENNYALFYEVQSNKTTKGEIFYKFMMSYTVKLSDKINKILNIDKSLSQMDDFRIERKCDVLRKIGLGDQQIYLELWKRSSQNTIKDYQFLLSTRSYKIIKNEVENKMKKASMRFKELIKIEESCLEILKSRITCEKCQKEDLQEYLVSHLLLRKLKLFKEIQLVKNREVIEKEKTFVMNIQEYHTYKNFKMKQVVQKIGLYLTTGQVSIIEIRTILYHFRFVYRHIYHDLLDDIVKQAKTDMKRLLVELPELLPIKTDDKDVLKQGIWGQISKIQWEQSLYKQKVSSLYNKDMVNAFTKEVWFRRNWLIMHDMIEESPEEINEIAKKNNSSEIFYFFIEKVFERIKEEDILEDLLSYIQAKYDKYPQHLRDKVILYSKLYAYHQNYIEIIKEPKVTFSAFLKFQDKHLFKFFFEFEKIKKGSLLRQIRQTYMDYADELEFNNGLLNYFKQDTSEISHLKYLLNRVNNEKKEFHSTHENMYAILVKAMQIKLKIGSECDIPIDQVLIYLENIPITSHNNRQIIQDLEAIQRISEQYGPLKEMKINMTIKEIIDSYELVMQKIVDYQIQKYKVLEITSQNQFISTTYRLLAQIQSMKKHIYGQIDNELALFIFFTKLMEHEDKISFTYSLLTDEYINNYFYIDTDIIQNIVRYMKRWKFSYNRYYIENQSYLKALVGVLPEGNRLKDFILEQIKFATLLSLGKQPIKYPLATYTPFPRLQELESILISLDKESLLKIDIDELIQIMKKLKNLSESASFDPKPNAAEGISGSFIGKGSQIDNYMINKSQLKSFEIKTDSLKSLLKRIEIKDQQIYELFIKIFIKKGLIQQSLPLIKKSIGMAQKYDIITILILIYHLFPEFNEQSKVYFVKIISRLYGQPLQLLAIIEKAILKSLTCLQMIEYLRGEYQRTKDQYLNYDPDSLIFNSYFRQIDDKADADIKRKIVKSCLIKLKRRRIQFRTTFLFDFLYIILCHHPESMSIFLKFLGVNRNKLIRSFFSHLITEQIFDEVHVLEVMKRVYYFILKSLKQSRSIYAIVRKYQNVSLVEDFQIKDYDQLNQLESKVYRNVKAFEKKKKKILSEDRSLKMTRFLSSDKEKSIKNAMEHPEKIFQKQKNQYVFSDSDDDYREDQKQHASPHLINVKNQFKFNPEKQRRQFLQKTPIRSRDQMNSNQEESPKAKDPILLNPLDLMSKSAKMKKLFSQDVRSHYDGEDPKEQSLDRSSNVGSIRTKQSLQIGPTHPFLDLSESNPEKQREIQRRKRRSSGKLQKVRAAESLDMNALIKPKQDLSSDNLFVENKKSQIQKSQHEDQKILEPIKVEYTEEQTNEKCEISELLEKVYKSYRPQLENEPYSLKALLACRHNNRAEFNRILPAILERIYIKPEKDVETALRLLYQIAEKIPESYLNKIFIDVFSKIAKLQSKYSLDLPIQKMFPLEIMYPDSTSLDQLFQLVVANILVETDYSKVQKIAKLLSLGFKRSSFQATFIEAFLKKQVEKLNRTKDKDTIGAQLKSMKQLNEKLNVKMLIELSDGVVKKATSTDMRKTIAKVFADVIRAKGKGRDANDLLSRFK